MNLPKAYPSLPTTNDLAPILWKIQELVLTNLYIQAILAKLVFTSSCEIPSYQTCFCLWTQVFVVLRKGNYGKISATITLMRLYKFHISYRINLHVLPCLKVENWLLGCVYKLLLVFTNLFCLWKILVKFLCKYK